MSEIPQCVMVGHLDIKALDICKRVYDPAGIAPTLTTSGGGYREVKIFDTKRLRVRKLTPTEYGRLQAFPMDRWKQVVSDSQAYKQFGNAVTTTVFTPIAEQIAKAIMEVENHTESEELNMDAENKEFGMNPPTQEEVADGPAAGRQGTNQEEVMEANTGHIEAGEMAEFITETLFNETLIPGILFEKIKNSIMQTLTQEFDGKTIGEPKEDARDWMAAEKALNDMLEKYASMGPAGMYGIRILSPLKVRLDQGEKTPDLFNNIVSATR